MLKKALFTLAFACCTISTTSVSAAVEANEIIACRDCGQNFGCRCHGKGKTNVTLLVGCPCGDKGKNITYACDCEGGEGDLLAC